MYIYISFAYLSHIRLLNIFLSRSLIIGPVSFKYCRLFTFYLLVLHRVYSSLVIAPAACFSFFQAAIFCDCSPNCSNSPNASLLPVLAIMPSYACGNWKLKQLPKLNTKSVARFLSDSLSFLSLSFASALRIFSNLLTEIQAVKRIQSAAPKLCSSGRQHCQATDEGGIYSVARGGRGVSQQLKLRY